ncbi:MAG: Polynucleotide 5'-hydroxyl-kinase grc3 [Cirrosporium novae-zelandiae]|nr:MAG: Polynucleotide 5'-hydroxyl-kinase grc3 [Cirrosporium novae-zelandiae]
MENSLIELPGEPQSALAAIRAAKRPKTAATEDSKSEPEPLQLTDATQYEDDYASVYSDASELVNDLPPRKLSTFGQNSKNIIESTKKSLRIRMDPQDRLTIIGQYNVWVAKGFVVILGFAMEAGPKIYTIFGSSTHSLPVIEVPRECKGGAEIVISHHYDHLRRLKEYSPLFGRIWNRTGTRTNLKGKENLLTRSFSILEHSHDDPFRRPLVATDLAPDWERLLILLRETKNAKRQKILVCGPSNTGKSTFCRYLLNYFLSSGRASKKGLSSVGYLDLDPGQPEFSPPGNLSLSHLKSPILGPQFTHPILLPGTNNKLVHAHHLGYLSPKDDPAQYIKCALDLDRRYEQQLHQDELTCPLVINTSGWVMGAGLEFLVEFIRFMKPSDVVYTSLAGPANTVGVLRRETEVAGSVFHELRHQFTEFTTRTSGDLRAMQTQSYFHINRKVTDQPQWTPFPVTYMRPLVIPYTDRHVIHGFMSLGERFDPRLAHDIFNGKVVGVAAVDENCPDLPSYKDISTDTIPINLEGTRFDESHYRTFTALPKHPLPYLFRGRKTNTPLPPATTTCLGQALIRGIDTEAGLLYILTPIPESVLASAESARKKIILVKGKLDIPGWAFKEEYYMASKEEREEWGGTVPWLRKLDGGEERGKGTKAWRVTRRINFRGDVARDAT